MRTKNPPTLDLRPLMKGREYMSTTVYLRDEIEPDYEWVRLGATNLSCTRVERAPLWLLTARIGGGVTDPEHDALKLLQLPLVGVSLEYVSAGMTMLAGYVYADADSFHVPAPGYDPTKTEGTEMCRHYTDCKKKPHLVVPDGHYVPPFDQDLFDLVRGRRVTIRIAPVTAAKSPR